MEFVSRMTALDSLLIALWAGAVVFGWYSGILRQLFLLASILAGGIIASTLVYGASFWTGVISGTGREHTLPFTYVSLIFLAKSLVFLLTIRSYPHTRLSRHKNPDRVVGGLLGFVVGLLVVNLLAAMLLMTTNDPWFVFDGARVSIRQQLDSTPFLPLVSSTFPQITSIVQNLLPA